VTEVGLIDEKKTEGQKSRETVPLNTSWKGQSHNKVYEVITFIDRLGPNEGSLTVLKNVESPVKKWRYYFTNRWTLDVKLASLIWRILLTHAIKIRVRWVVSRSVVASCAGSPCTPRRGQLNRPSKGGIKLSISWLCSTVWAPRNRTWVVELLL
jgi:hypothetical protein